jgi:DNA-directed RNA polymerase specialized sigma24 family protein
MNADVPESQKCRESPEHAQRFASRFSRYRPLLHSLACRVLADIRCAEDAVENCWRTASRNPPKFDCEGAFRSWLARVLIDEALAILRENRELAALFLLISIELVSKT